MHLNKAIARSLGVEKYEACWDDLGLSHDALHHATVRILHEVDTLYGLADLSAV